MNRPRPAIELEHPRRGAAMPRACDHPGCAASGEFRAPRSRTELDRFYWFCLDHVRAYNLAWDYYRGMSPEEIERERRRDTVGQRPTWPMGPRGDTVLEARLRGLDPAALEAALRRLMGEDDAPPRRTRPASPEEEALRTLGLQAGASFAQVKSRYKELVERHHPDANGGDKAAEERLKSINQAYTLLKSQASGARQAPGR